MPFLFLFYFCIQIPHRLLECYWSCNVLFICPSMMCGLIPPNLLFLLVCFLLHCHYTDMTPVCAAAHTAVHLEILSVALSTFCHAWVICSLCVNIRTNGRWASVWNALSVHVDWNQWLEILYICPMLWLSSWSTLQTCIFFLFHLKQQVFVCELCSVWVGWLWLINFPDVFEQK